MNIIVSLSSKSFEEARRKIMQRTILITEQQKELVTLICKQGKEHARTDEILSGAGTGFENEIYDTGRLQAGIRYKVYRGKYVATGKIISSAVDEKGTNYVRFVEYGWGLAGGEKPHPKPGVFGHEGYQYDGTGKGLRGFMSRPYMYNTALYIRNNLHTWAKRVMR